MDRPELSNFAEDWQEVEELPTDESDLSTEFLEAIQKARRVIEESFTNSLKQDLIAVQVRIKERDSN